MKSLNLDLSKFDGAYITEGVICIPVPDAGKPDGKGLFTNKDGDRVYASAILWENQEGEDEYGNMGSVQLSIPKEAREAGEKGAYIGSMKEFGN